jgi:hypothetical protein
LPSVYGKEDGGADTAVWLAGSKEKIDQLLPGISPSSVAHETIETLRDIGLLDDIIATREGLVVYPINFSINGQPTVQKDAAASWGRFGGMARRGNITAIPPR